MVELESAVLVVTENAGMHLEQLLRMQGSPDGMVVRLVNESQGIAVQQDSQRVGDTTFQHEGRTVLVLDAEVSTLLSNDTLDLEGNRLSLQPKQEPK